MAKIHAFNVDDNGKYRVVLHTPMPSGNNVVGNAWSSIWIAAGRNVTSMIEGTGVGQISSAEKAQIVAAVVIEIDGLIPSEIITQDATAVNIFADNLIDEAKQRLQRQYAHYGWTNG